MKTLNQRTQEIDAIMEKLEADGLIANENTRERLIEEADNQYLETLNADLDCQRNDIVKEMGGSVIII